MQAVSETHSQLIVVVDIEFVKPCLFKGRIEAEAWSGLKKYYDMVDKEVGKVRLLRFLTALLII